MGTLLQRDKGTQPGTLLNRMDRLFEEWVRTLGGRRPFGLGGETPGEDVIRVDEYRDGDALVVRAEIPGVDPDRDIELSVSDGMLQIKAERRTEEKTETKGYERRELRYGSFRRALPLPPGVSESDVTATYRDGILEVRIPVPEPPAEQEPRKIAINKG
ncbi:Hsp20/alpha crystallin family protein [Pseudonocardia sp. H11422]|uniref:Hsp20/alpha crystallin family protein n=1 Tax=Pseudonocardia sp. H11422 TaxID=2835866 RepID=UPI001BDCAE22|nr:Hsp20/alpha crystallin family protein [Pseudonocardia sp. H11422]